MFSKMMKITDYENYILYSNTLKEKFEADKSVIRIHKSKKDRQCNGQKKKKIKIQAMNSKALHRKLKIEQRPLKHLYENIPFASGAK